MKIIRNYFFRISAFPRFLLFRISAFRSFHISAGFTPCDFGLSPASREIAIKIATKVAPCEQLRKACSMHSIIICPNWESVRSGRGGFRCGRFVDEIGTCEWLEVFVLHCWLVNFNFRWIFEPIATRQLNKKRNKTAWTTNQQALPGKWKIYARKKKSFLKKIKWKFLKKNLFLLLLSHAEGKYCLQFPEAL